MQPSVMASRMRLATVVALGAALLCAPAPARADFVDGVKAYEAGDYAAAYAQWLPLAEKNDVAAQRNIGHLYRWGQGVEKNIETAMQWYRRAAELGFSRAQANLAAIYLQGEEGVAVNYDEAHKWFAAAAIQGHAVAQYNLGLMFELGLGVEKSEPKALGWYNLAAKSGQPEALERLSQMVRKTETPLVSGVGVNAPVESQAVMPQAAASQPQAASTDTVSEVLATPSSAAPAPAVEPTAPVEAATPVETATPAAAPAAEPERPGFLARFYNAISSGGGVSIPDIFDSGETKPAPADGSKP